MVDREKLIRRLQYALEDAEDDDKIYAEIRRPVLVEAILMLKEQEAVSAHWDDDTEHWIEGDRDGIDPHTRTTGETIDTFRCSWCGFYQYWKTPFCPNCGAKMEGR